jgi:type IV pilus assembly protein PilA
MKFTQNKNTGFTLIELMIVVAIIGILAAVAIPSYQNYINKARFSEVELAAAGLKTATDLCIKENNGVLANCNAGSGGIPATAENPSNYVSAVTVTQGEIIATARNIGSSNTTFTLSPTWNATTGTITWIKGGTCITAGYCTGGT